MWWQTQTFDGAVVVVAPAAAAVVVPVEVSCAVVAVAPAAVVVAPPAVVVVVPAEVSGAVVVVAPATAVVVSVEVSGAVVPAPSATAAVTPAASVAIAPTSMSIRLMLSLPRVLAPTLHRELERDNRPNEVSAGQVRGTAVIAFLSGWPSPEAESAPPSGSGVIPEHWPKPARYRPSPRLELLVCIGGLRRFLVRWWRRAPWLLVVATVARLGSTGRRWRLPTATRG